MGIQVVDSQDIPGNLAASVVAAGHIVVVHTVGEHTGEHRTEVEAVARLRRIEDWSIVPPGAEFLGLSRRPQVPDPEGREDLTSLFLPKIS